MGPLPKYNRIKAKRRKPSPKLRANLDAGRAELMHQDSRVYAPLTIMRHPTIASSVRFLPKQLETDHIVVVINHPAVRADGSVDYELSAVFDNIKAVYGIAPKLCPISPVIASACRGKQSQDISLDGLWRNIFDVPPNCAHRRIAGEPIIIGRHSRDSRDKWPADADTIRAAYPLADGIQIKVLGGGETPKAVLGELPANWEVLSFDPFGAEAFLRAIDVYVYFHHSGWVEAFGRAPCEAMLSGIPTILPPTFKPTFGEAALYCEPAEVLAVVRKLQLDPTWYAEVSERGRRVAIEQFGSGHHIERLMRTAGISPRRRLAQYEI